MVIISFTLVGKILYVSIYLSASFLDWSSPVPNSPLVGCVINTRQSKYTPTAILIAPRMPLLDLSRILIAAFLMAKLVLGQGQCGSGSNQNSDCRNAFSMVSALLLHTRWFPWPSPVNSLTDFCLFAPPSPGADSTIGDTEVSISFWYRRLVFNISYQRIEVAWCMRVSY